MAPPSTSPAAEGRTSAACSMRCAKPWPWRRGARPEPSGSIGRVRSASAHHAARAGATACNASAAALLPHVAGPPRGVPDLDLEMRTLSERTTDTTPGDNAALLADLTDLLQLEFDALPAYSVAIAGLRRPDLRETLEAYRADHE